MTAGHLIKVFLGRCATAMDLGDQHLARIGYLEPMLKSLLAIQKNELPAERVAIARERLQQKTAAQTGSAPRSVAVSVPPSDRTATPPTQTPVPSDPATTPLPAATSVRQVLLSVVPKHPTPLTASISHEFPPLETVIDPQFTMPIAV